MITKPIARRFRIRRSEPAAPAPAAQQPAAEVDDGFGAAPYTGSAALITAPAEMASEADLDAIRREGLTGRQLRLARRVAQKHNLPATSDFDAVRLLRKAGIDPFQRASVLELVTSAGGMGGGAGEPPNAGSRALATMPAGSPNLPATLRPVATPSPEVRAEASHLADIARIQRDIARRRRRKTLLLAARLMFFVVLPTIIAGYYFSQVATPLYATKSEFVIQQAEAQQSGLGGLFSGTQFATSQDSIAVQGYLQSREAMQRLDRDVGFARHFAGPEIDAILRLPEGASGEDAYSLYKQNVKIGYDQTEGIIKMEVSAPSPELSAAWSAALISYAESQVDNLTQRLREDQMSGARASYEEAEKKMTEAQLRVLELQEKFKVLSSEVEVQLLSAQITNLETQLTQDRLSLIQMMSNPVPNRARMEPLERRIGTIEAEIARLRGKLTEDSASGVSIAKVQSELLVAQADLETRQLLLSQSLQQMETARVEANRQVRYLSVSVSPVAPDVPTYPRVFENTALVMLIFAGIYLVMSMTAAILREQVAA